MLWVFIRFALIFILMNTTMYVLKEKYGEAVLTDTHNVCFYGEIRKIVATEVIQMDTHNVCFYGEIRKIISKIPYLLLCIHSS